MDLKRRDVSDGDIRDAILWKFWRMRAFGKRHIYESDVPKGMPPHLRKRIMEQVKELKRQDLITEFPHGKEHAFVLNMQRIEEIKDILKSKYGLI